MLLRSLKYFTICALKLWLTSALATSTTSNEDLNSSDWRSIQQQIQDRVYTAEIRPDGGYWARNPVHGLDILYAPNGTTELRPRQGDDWRWTLTTREVGNDRFENPVKLEQDGQIITYHWTSNIREWWINQDTGLEQWFEIHQRPTELKIDESLTVIMAVDSSLRGISTEEAIAFTDDTGATVFTYDQLRVWDATGRELPAQMGVDGQILTLTVNDAGAVYPLTIDPTIAVPGAYLKADNAGPGDWFGESVAISDDTIVVGAPKEDGIVGNSGAAYVFVRSGNTWVQQAYLKANDADISDWFGSSVAISGDTVVVGAPRIDTAYIFVRSGDTWSQQERLKAENDIEFVGASFGSAVAISGDTVVVGAIREHRIVNNIISTFPGTAYIFERTGSNWSQQASFKASNAEYGDEFGTAVSISGDTVVVGAPFEDSNATTVNGDGNDNSALQAGAAYVFVQSGDTWTQQAYLKADNAEAGDLFGVAVAASNDTIVIGAEKERSASTEINGNGNDNSARFAGAAYVFVRSDNAWTQQAYLKAHNAATGAYFGNAVAVEGDKVIVGSFREMSNANGVNGEGSPTGANASGAAYIFNRTGTYWSQNSYLKADDVNGGDYFGHAVSISGNTVVVGARNHPRDQGIDRNSGPIA